MNSHEREMAPQVAAQAVRGYFDKFRGKPDQFGSHRESGEALEGILYYLREMDAWGTAEKRNFYYHLREGCPDGVDFDVIYGDLAFELLVQFALAHDAFAVTPRVLRFTREQAQAIPSLGSIAAITLARAVTAACRDRYGRHLGPPAENPPERIAPQLGRDRAGEIALRYLRWVAESPSRPTGHARDIEGVIAACRSANRTNLNALLHDLREGYRVEEPKRVPRKSAARATYRRHCQTALAVAVEDFRREGFTAEDIVSERAWMLARELDVSLEEAFGFLLCVAARSRNP